MGIVKTRLGAFMILLIYTLKTSIILGQLEDEPRCTSRFDYDYEVLQKLLSLEQEVSNLKRISDEQGRLLSKTHTDIKGSGDTYVRWGRTVCPGNGSSLVYHGYMAGSKKEHTGTGSNYLCLTSEPLWDHFEDSVESLGKITGAEYQFWYHKDNGAALFLGENMYNHNAPCAVCHTTRSTTLMIPGRNRCYDGWTEEFRGYLMSGYFADPSATEYVCLDRRPEKVVNGDADDEDNRVYFVEAVCGGSLACPPYVGGREITCVVCSI